MTATPSLHSRLTNSLPEDAAATLVGRLWQPGIGPTVVLAADGALHDASSVAATVSQLLNLADPVGGRPPARGGGPLGPPPPRRGAGRGGRGRGAGGRHARVPVSS
jgi:hypothetical protein